MLECAKNELVGALFTPSTSAKNELYSIYSHVYLVKAPAINTLRTTGAPPGALPLFRRYGRVR